MARAQRGAVDPQCIDDAGAHVVDEDVGGFEQAMKLFDALRGLQVEGDRGLVAVHVEEVQRVPVLKRCAHVARVIAQLRLLNFDDVGTEVGEYGCCVRRRQHLADFDHSDAFKHRSTFAASILLYP